MFIPDWLIGIISVSFISSILVAYRKHRQVRVMRYCFQKMSDFAINSLKEIHEDMLASEEVNENAIPYAVNHALKEWEKNVDYYLGVMKDHRIGRFSVYDGAIAEKDI